MLQNTQALVLQCVRFQEKSLVVQCYTQSSGMCSFFVKNAFSKNKSQHISYFQPLTQLSISFVEKQSESLNYFKSIELSSHYATIHTDFNKSIVVLFLSEVLAQLLRNEPADNQLFAFIATELNRFDEVEKNGDFHLNFLINLTKYTGFYPDVSQTDFPYFNLSQGCFSDEFVSNECLGEEQSALLKKIVLPDERTLLLNGKQRKMIVEILLNYYKHHIENFRMPKTLEVINEIFG